MDKLCILIKILVESHMAFNLGDKTNIREHTDRQTTPGLDTSLSMFSRMSMLSCKIEDQYDLQILLYWVKALVILQKQQTY